MTHDFYDAHPFRWRNFTVNTHFDGLQPLDKAVWAECIQQFPELYKKVAYNVPVGLEKMPPPKQGDNIPRNWMHLVSPKIDAVGFTGESLVVIEVKPQLTPEAIGQVLVYKSLFIKRWQPDFPVDTQIATLSARPDYQFFVDTNGIDLLIPDAPHTLRLLLYGP